MRVVKWKVWVFLPMVIIMLPVIILWSGVLYVKDYITKN